MKYILMIVVSIAVLAMFGCSGPELITPERDAPARDFDVIEGGNVHSGDIVTIVVPFLAGGDTDRYARMLAPLLSDHLGIPIAIINIDGATGNTGALYVHNAEPDGYTVLFYHTGDMFSNFMHDVPHALDYMDFAMAAVAFYCDANVMVVCATLGIYNAQGFLAYARANPHSLRTAIVEQSFGHVLLDITQAAGGFQTEAIDVGSARLKAQAVIGSHADLAMNHVSLFLDYIDSGELVPLFVASSTRNPRLPDVPTMEEVGIINGYIGRSYFFAFPYDTPLSIVQEWSAAVGAIAENPFLLAQLEQAGASPPSFVPYYEIALYMYRARAAFLGAQR